MKVTIEIQDDLYKEIKTLAERLMNETCKEYDKAMRMLAN